MSKSIDIKFKAIEEAKNETLKIIKSGIPAVHLCGDDYSQMDKFVEELANELGYDVIEWNYGYGLVNFKTKQMKNENEKEISFDEFLNGLCAHIDLKKQLVVIKNAAFALEGESNAKNLACLQQTLLFNIKNKERETVLVYCDEKQFIPDQLVSLVHFVELKPPATEELEKITEKFIANNDINFSDKKELAKICTGMSEDTLMRILKQAALEKDVFSRKVIEIAKKTKKQVVSKSCLLELVETDTRREDIGGLEHMIWWLGVKKNAILDPANAIKYGVQPAKGILLAGMPGCGKSLSAKAIANMYNIPLLHLDVGTLMDKYLGQSEEKLRRALRLAENASPCVLWVDEIEKAFAGINGDETGVTQRLFGYLLTWLNDKTAAVFVVATSNDIAVLPWEFMRRGRFDEIFSVNFPNESERKQIFTIHIKKALKRRQEQGFDVDAFIKKIDAGLDELAKNENIDGSKNTEGFAGSDIAYLVNDAIETIWNGINEKEKSFIEVIEAQLIQTLKDQKEYVKPLKEVLTKKIEKNLEKFGEYKLTSASLDERNEQAFDVDSRPTAILESRKKVASDPRCPQKYLERLATDDNREVLLALIANKNCPFEAIARLKDNLDEEIKKTAMEKFLRSETGIIEIAKNGSKEQKLKLPSLSSPSLPEAAQEALAEDADIDVAAELIWYKYLSDGIKKRLIERAMKDEALGEKIKANPNCTPEIKEQLERSCEKCANTRKKSSSPNRGSLICTISNHQANKACGLFTSKASAKCINCVFHGGDGPSISCRVDRLMHDKLDSCSNFKSNEAKCCQICSRATRKGSLYFCPLDYNLHKENEICGRFT
jgi:SpoVK/Ycf46/Vps4 family AAA+-type ATPase